MSKPRFVFVSALTIAAAALCGSRARAVDQVRDVPAASTLGAAIVQGVVVNDDEQRKPLRNVTVTLDRSGLEDIRTVATDEAGRYRFDRLPAGRYTLSFKKGAYISMDYGAPRAGLTGQAITLTDGQTFEARVTALLHGSAIAGRVLDPIGNPLANVVVKAAQVVSAGGQRKPRLIASEAAYTNAHGDYRMFGLLPGAYVVSAQYEGAIPPTATSAELQWARQSGATPAPERARASAYAPSFYPGTPSADAADFVTVGKAEARTGVDFTLRTMPVARIRGVVIGADGQPASGVTVSMALTHPPAFLGYPVRVARSLEDGSFSWESLPPGDYTISVRGGPTMPPRAPSAPPASLQEFQQAPFTQRPWWGRLDLSVAGVDLNGLTIAMKPGLQISGRVVMEGTGAPPWQVSALRFSLAGDDSLFSTFSGSGSADGSLSAAGVAPGTYRLTMTLPATPDNLWAVKSARLGDRDLLDDAVELSGDTSDLVVTISNALARVSGQITTADGSPASRLSVMLFSTNPADWRIRSRRIRDARTSDTGTFAIDGLPAGEYYVCALTEIDTEMRFEPEYLQQLIPAAIKLTLADGEKRVQNLQIGR
ncbi:MAG TPA: carboxypeptidase-like regulatory domain-containing protein [Vicinamibacterales bacterium]|nr:carboxypeptidase-like regulatory domain-containing protein [Vicinamibacterales bacterium]